ncbi:MAG: acyltransferase [Bacillota bacterium]
MRDFRIYPVSGKNSMHYMYRLVKPWRVIRNFIIIQVCRYTPSLEVKSFLYRKFLGMKVERDAAIGLMVMMDIFFPDMISIGSNSIIGYNTTILCHEFLVEEYRLGPVNIGANVMIGANTTVLPGVNIGEGAVVAACSLVNRDVSPYSTVGGVPIRELGKARGYENVAND